MFLGKKLKEVGVVNTMGVQNTARGRKYSTHDSLEEAARKYATDGGKGLMSLEAGDPNLILQADFHHHGCCYRENRRRYPRDGVCWLHTHDTSLNRGVDW